MERTGTFVKNQYYISFWISLTVALALIVIGFFIPPKGQVDGSVITSVGVLFLWPALAFGNKALEEGKTAKITKGDMVVTINESDNGDEEQSCE